jgi:hypothetical protein
MCLFLARKRRQDQATKDEFAQHTQEKQDSIINKPGNLSTEYTEIFMLSSQLREKVAAATTLKRL